MVYVYEKNDGMSSRANDPGRRGGDTTTLDVAALISAITLPPIERFGADSALLTGLPAYTPCPVPNPEPLSRVLVARSVYDNAVEALAALKRLEDATAACRAALIDRLMGAAFVEGTSLALDRWQSGMSEQSARTEIAAVLCIPEGTATTMVRHATELVGSHPATRDALAAGKLSWRHVGTVIDETDTLSQTPGMTPEDLHDFEQHLLKLAPGSTATRFKSKARRLREGTHPESLPVRSKEAILARAMTMEPGRDGMSWLTLHLPAPAAEGVWVHCTRLARKLQCPDENRTLAQLRIDVAAALLLGQSPIDQSKAGQSTLGQHRLTAPLGEGRSDGAPDDGHFDDVSFVGAARGSGGVDPGAVSTFGGDPLQGDPLHGAAVRGAGAIGAVGAVGAVGADPDGDEGAPFDPAPWDLSKKSSFGDWPDSPILKGIRMAAPGYLDGVVDGIPEDPMQDYLDMLAATRAGKVITEPPLPEAQILLTVPVLGALGITNEPAELIGYGPIPETTARKLLANSSTFLRLFTDPITNEPLEMNPDRYRVRESERAVLRAMAQTCYFPNCTGPVLVTELDHVQAWEIGGKSTPDNQRPACARHHALKHFRDDKDKHGRSRRDRDPDRAGIRLRGWKPSTTPDGRINWQSPSGRVHPGPPRELRPPAYPKWLKKKIARALHPTRVPPAVPPSSARTSSAQPSSAPPSIIELILAGKHVEYRRPEHR